MAKTQFAPTHTVFGKPVAFDGQTFTDEDGGKVDVGDAPALLYPTSPRSGEIALNAKELHTVLRALRVGIGEEYGAFASKVDEATVMFSRVEDGVHVRRLLHLPQAWAVRYESLDE